MIKSLIKRTHTSTRPHTDIIVEGLWRGVHCKQQWFTAPWIHIGALHEATAFRLPTNAVLVNARQQQIVSFVVLGFFSFGKALWPSNFVFDWEGANHFISFGRCFCCCVVEKSYNTVIEFFSPHCVCVAHTHKVLAVCVLPWCLFCHREDEGVVA